MSAEAVSIATDSYRYPSADLTDFIDSIDLKADLIDSIDSTDSTDPKADSIDPIDPTDLKPDRLFAEAFASPLAAPPSQAIRPAQICVREAPAVNPPPLVPNCSLYAKINETAERKSTKLPNKNQRNCRTTLT